MIHRKPMLNCYHCPMRVTPEQIAAIRLNAALLAGADARVWLFGSRVDDQTRGGDVDLMLELDAPVAEPAQLAARLAAKVSRAMHGRKVDVLIKAPNLMLLPIHSVALAQGVRL
jgi:predicted nucleotidyltransferase